MSARPFGGLQQDNKAPPFRRIPIHPFVNR
jgi:hypothetical protein